MEAEDRWELLKKYWSEFLELNGLVVAEQTKISALQTIISVVAMRRNCFLGTERTNEDLRNQYLRSDSSRTNKGLLVNLMIMIINRLLLQDDENEEDEKNEW